MDSGHRRRMGFSSKLPAAASAVSSPKHSKQSAVCDPVWAVYSAGSVILLPTELKMLLNKMRKTHHLLLASSRGNEPLSLGLRDGVHLATHGGAGQGSG